MLTNFGEIEIKKSRFCFYRIDGSIDEFTSQLENLKAQHKKATHVCFAYSFSSPFEEKCSDDGEPKGTAGQPILSVIKKKGLTNVGVVVVRYFGGIKLGAGGLVRAYTKSASEALKGERCK